MAQPINASKRQTPPYVPPFITRTYDESPDWIKDTGNAFVRRYYRPEFQTFGEAIRSILPSPIHNQLGNIYTHLTAAIIAMIIELCSFRHESDSTGRRWEIHTYRSMAMLCFSFSTIYHVCNVIRRWKVHLNRLDYAGILLYLSGGGASLISYAFDQHPTLRLRYLLMGLCITLVLLYNMLNSEQFHTEIYRPYRAAIFLVYGLSIIVPLAHASYYYSIGGYSDGLLWFSIFLVAALSCYAWQIPERYFAGSFDMFPSHSFFHLFVSFASYSFYCKLWALFDD